MRLHAFNAKKEYQKLMFKKNKAKYLKYGTIILSLCILVFAIMYFSFSKFSTTKKFNVINAKVGDFSSGDFTIAAYIDGTKSSTFPDKDSEYGIEKVECTNNAVGYFDYSTMNLNVKNISPSTKCNIYFIKNIAGKILNIAGGRSSIEAKTTPTFSNIATTDEGMFATTDDYGTSYYYRGAVTQNNIIFGGFCWKVIRINGDGTTRMIYNGTPTNGTCVATGTSTQIGTSAFNSTNNDNAYVGYMYGTAGSTTYSSTHANTNSSTIKTMIDNWYATNLVSYASKISDTLFCNDRTLVTGTGIGTVLTDYSAYKRVESTYAPILICQNQQDRFTVNDSYIGNAKLSYPIGLITADESSFAGSKGILSNSSYYLYSNSAFWTLSPAAYQSGGYIFKINSNGEDDYSLLSSVLPVRPVINLNGDAVSTSGTGTSSDPYIIS